MSTDIHIDDGTKVTKSGKPIFVPNALTTFEKLVAGGNPHKEILLRRANANYDKILADVIREMLQQKIAALHYEAINNYVLFAPTMVITLLSAIISIFGTSQLIDDPNTKIWFSIIVACLQLVLSVLQSLSKQLNFGARSGFHRSASATLKKMYQNARHARIETRMQSMRKAIAEDSDLTDGFVHGNVEYSLFYGDVDDESSNSDKPKGEKKGADGTPTDNNNEGQEEEEGEGKLQRKKRMARQTTDSLTRQFKQAVDQVDSFVPVRVANAFNVMESRVRCINESLLTSKKNSLVAWEQVLMALYFQLAETIIEWRGFPFIIPGPRKAVDQTLKNFKKAISVDNVDNPADLLDVILDRSEQVGQKQTLVVDARRKRSIRLGRDNVPTGVKIAKMVVENIDAFSDEEEVIFRDAENDVESGTSTPNYGTMT